MALPQEDLTVDIHCVTRWSKFDTVWRGVSLDSFLAEVDTAADFAVAHSEGDYTTNLPLADLQDGKAWLAHTYDGFPLSPEHGGPVRLLVPHLYFWKSAKWVDGLALSLRSYSLAGPARKTEVELGVQAVPDGEVSPYLAQDLPVGAEVEVRGPPGGWFVWRPEQEDPILLVAGGCGIVPLMAMIRTHRLHGSAAPMRLVYSVRDPDQVWYRDELTAETAAASATRIVYTRRAPQDSSRPPGRITADDLAPPAGTAQRPELCFVCGPTGFVEHAAGLLTGAGHRPDRIRTERFG